MLEYNYKRMLFDGTVILYSHDTSRVRMTLLKSTAAMTTTAAMATAAAAAAAAAPQRLQDQ